MSHSLLYSPEFLRNDSVCLQGDLFRRTLPWRLRGDGGSYSSVSIIDQGFEASIPTAREQVGSDGFLDRKVSLADRYCEIFEI